MIACLLMTFLMIQTVQAVLTVPQLKDVYCEPKSKTIHVSWTDAPSIIVKKAIYDIEVYNPGQKEAVYTDSVEKKPNPSSPHHWQWISPLPLECLPHAVRLRVRHNNNISEWTDLRNVTGLGLDHSTVSVYPKEDNALEGSKKTFCCSVPEGKTIKEILYKNLNVTNYTKVGQTYIFELTLKPSDTHGDALHCEEKNGDFGVATVFVGYFPEVQNFTCETRNLRVLECSWTQGNDRNLQGLRQTKYFLNGSSCPNPEDCSVEISPNLGEVVWNLTAKNDLGTRSFTYRANPRHRVRLPAPQDLNAIHVDSTNASLKWHWPGTNLQSLSMQCEVWMRPNKPEPVRKETGAGLHSVTLQELHPYTNYSVRVRCASAEHFWKWGDWSENISFTTKEDIPQAVDVWMTADSSNRNVVVWKKLTAEQSHGLLKKYHLRWGDSVQHLSTKQHCYHMSSDDVVKVTVTAVNTVGHSSPSTVMTPLQPTDVKKTFVHGSLNGSLELSWDTEPGASFGYVLDWYPTGSQDKCGIEWMKIPAGRKSAKINSGLRDGVRYTFSLYARTSNAPKLLQRWEGYAQELAPDKGPNIYIEQDGHDIRLFWDVLENQRGFIQAYVINYSLSLDINMGKHKSIVVQFRREQEGVVKKMQRKIPNLLAETYIFSISAFTSGGEGPAAKQLFTLESHSHQIIVRVIISLGLVIVMAALVPILCYQKRTWLKRLVYPEIPAPQINCSTSNGIHVFQLLEIPAENVEHLMAHEIKPSVEDGEISFVPVTNNDCPTQYQNVTGLDINFTDDTDGSLSNHCLILDNPSYNPLVSNNAAPAAKAAATERDDPQTPSPSPQLPACSDSYHALKYACQAGQLETNGRSPLEGDDDCAFDSVQSQTSVSLSQPLLGYQPRQLDHIHPQLIVCSTTYQALEDICSV